MEEIFVFFVSLWPVLFFPEHCNVRRLDGVSVAVRRVEECFIRLSPDETFARRTKTINTGELLCDFRCKLPGGIWRLHWPLGRKSARKRRNSKSFMTELPAAA